VLEWDKTQSGSPQHSGARQGWAPTCNSAPRPARCKSQRTDRNQECKMHRSRLSSRESWRRANVRSSVQRERRRNDQKNETNALLGSVLPRWAGVWRARAAGHNTRANTWRHWTDQRCRWGRCVVGAVGCVDDTSERARARDASSTTANRFPRIATRSHFELRLCTSSLPTR
jgi:hypothetical protein